MEAAPPPPKEARVAAQGLVVADARPFLPELPAELWRVIGKMVVWLEDHKLRQLSMSDLASVRLLSRAAAHGTWRAIYTMAAARASYDTQDAIRGAQQLSWGRLLAREGYSIRSQAQAGLLSMYYTHTDVLRTMRHSFKHALCLDDRAACKGIIVATRAIRDEGRTIARYHAVGSHYRATHHRHVEGYASEQREPNFFLENC